MLVKISLDVDSRGNLADVVCPINNERIVLGTVITGVRALHVRNKPNKVVNDYQVIHLPKLDDFGDRTFSIKSVNATAELARVTINMGTLTYSLKRNAIERKRGLSVEFEVAVQKRKKG